MKTKRKTNFSLIIIAFLILLSLGAIFPNYANPVIEKINSPFLRINQNLALPYFSEEPFKLGLDLEGGSHLVYQADLSSIEEGKRDEAMQGLKDVIERRVNFFGVSEPQIVIQKITEQKKLVRYWGASPAIDTPKHR